LADAIIATPFDEPRVANVIDQLDADPERVARIRTNNVVNSLLKSDWSTGCRRSSSRPDPSHEANDRATPALRALPRVSGRPWVAA